MKTKLAVIVASLVLSQTVYAEPNDTGILASTDAVRAKLLERFPEVKIEDVRPSQWHGLYEVVTPQELVYVSDDGEFLFTGPVIETKTNENFTRQPWNQ